MNISAQQVKELRERTGAGMMECKKCLQEAEGDMEQAVELLKRKGLAEAEKKIGRTASEGVVSSYIHGNGRLGVLVEVNCETDFVGKNEEFKTFARDIAMHIAAMQPEYISRSEIPEHRIEKERETLQAQADTSGKPEHIVAKMVEGKLSKALEAITLLEQPFVKDPDKTVDEVQRELIARLGENVRIRRFERFEVGEGIEVEETDFAEEVRATLQNG